MPTPHPESESKKDFISRCIPIVMDDGTAQDSDQAVAICNSMWSDAMKSAKPHTRAYSVLEIRATDEEKRILEGMASTPEIDSYNTVLEPEGAEFRLPLPVLYQHNSRQPIGKVIDAKVSKKGIQVRIQLAKQGVAGFIDEAWSLIKNGLVPGLSVGFETIEREFDKAFEGDRITKWRWLELSTVTIPANVGATISAVRSADEAILAALGTKDAAPVVRLNINLPGASGHSKEHAMKTITEHIAALKQKRTVNDDKLDKIMNKVAEEGRTRDAGEQEEHETLTRENTALDSDIQAFEEREKTLVKRATAVAPLNGNGKSPEQNGQATREARPVVEHVTSMVPKGVNMARAAIALYHANGARYVAEEFAKRRWPDDPSVAQIINYQLRTGVEAGDTTTSGWASQLVSAAQNAPGEFLEMLRAATILGRIAGFRRVPFNVAVPLQSGAGTYQWVGEAVGKPVTSLTFSSVTLRWAKAAGIIVITEELAKFSTPSAEVIIRDEMIQGLTRFLDSKFIGTDAEVTNVSPAGILNGISATTTTGTTAAFFRTDMNNMLNNFTVNNQNPTQVTIIMSATQALALSLMVTDLGVPLFPSISLNGGSIFGLPVVISEAVGQKIIALIPSQIFIAEDPGIMLDVSREASVEMETTPAVGEQSPLTTVSNIKSFWQNNLVGFRVERFQTWKAGRTSAIEYITGNAYVP
jgi:HK97 family phage major capsid protein/HK97 family phage prohead protease